MSFPSKDRANSKRKAEQESHDIGLGAIDAMNAGSTTVELRKTDPSVIESEVVGRNDDVRMVIDMLVNWENEKDLAVISVVGMPGQGKLPLLN
ncbi:hypothetical protein K7X08_029849 [Anisodus acutangulus]|uniref:Uncharacterized protein n=1 Tax=Anisodus acutangulus TaxID=402998 RepID=A0A9Q1RBR3_9SOLA|nr:hypothetical protein K7X08_029849 [Anisodus acutangulus]